MDLKPIKTYLDDVVERNMIPGACYAYVTADQTWMSVSGYRSKVPSLEVNTLESVYDLASLTKVVATTTAVLLLLQQGKLTLMTKVCRILPRFRHADITIKDLLTHTSGITGNGNDYKHCNTKDEFITYVYDLDLSYETGTRVLYTDFNFILLGFVIEALTDMPIDVFCAKAIFEPLQMAHSGYLSYIVDPSLCASTEVTALRGVIRGVVHDGKALMLEGKSGNAGVFSTVGDLSHFVTMFLQDGMFNGKRFLLPETIGLLKHCYTEGLDFKRTLGWLKDEPTSAIGDYHSDDMIFHTGFTGTSILIDFKNRCGIILLTNRIHPDRDNPLIEEIRNTVMNLTMLHR